MKTILLTTSLLSISAAAQAQMVFDAGEISTMAKFPTGAGLSDFYIIGLDGKVAVSFGRIGIQADLGYDTLLGSGAPSGIGDLNVGIHTYYKISEAVKAGIFYTNEGIYVNGSSSSSFSTYGAEVAIDFGKLDAEISIGAASDAFGPGSIVTIDAYYQISDPFSVNAGVWAIIDPSSGGDVTGIATIGASYSLANAPVSFGLAYNAGFLSGGGSAGGSIEAKVSYSFGGGRERLFGTRNIDYLGILTSLTGGI